MPPILNFVSPALALKYLGLCFLSITGALQIVAGKRGIEGLSLFPSSLRLWQIIIGLILITGSFAIFFIITPEVFTPGLAGSELMILFGCGGILALAFSTTVAELRGSLHFYPIPPDAEEDLREGKAAFFGTKPGEKIDFCLIPDPWEPFSLDFLAHQLANSGFKVVVLHWQAIPDEISAIAFPALALEKYGAKIILGHRMGGNIALHLASQNSRVKAIAIAPFPNLEEARPGIRWLIEGGILTAFKRLRRRDRIVKALLPVEIPTNSVIINPETEDRPWGMVLNEGIVNICKDKAKRLAEEN